MRKANSLIVLLSLAVITSCSTASNNAEESEESNFVEYNNPPAEGFNQEGSDLVATLLADKAMNAMGGRKAWDETKYLKWNFFGRRTHLWNKQSGDIRIEYPDAELTVLMNINTDEGKVLKGGEELTNADSLSKYLDRGKRMWINDSYWLVMPFKLKDSGVTLTYQREDTTLHGTSSDVIRMTFEEVGVTPENIYDIWIDFDSKLVTQWAYYPSIESAEARFVNPWLNYERYGNILLSGDRGNNKLTDIEAPTTVPDRIFEDFDVAIP